MSPSKTCAVCGDKALGYNFNAVTCESCKAFFRRNALSKKTFSCPFNQNCQITLVTRRFCQKCRLDKCLAIGMKSENIMSEEDRMLKRRKIEDNRAKRKQRDNKKQELSVSDANCDDNQSNASFDSTTTCSNNNLSSGNSAYLNSSPSSITSPLRSVSRTSQPEHNIEALSSSEIVEIIVSDPDRASQAISSLMRSKEETLYCIEKVLSCQVDALRLISHLIAYPGDALKIISKIMNSPFNALTVFTKFMSSPTDALEIISKVVDSPQDVVQFIRNLMNAPEDALDIIQKFMTTPAEALRMLNRILSSTHAINEENATTKDATTKTTTVVNDNAKLQQGATEKSASIIQSMLAPSPSNSSINNEQEEAMVPLASTAATTKTNEPQTDAAGTNDLHMRHLMQQVFSEGVGDGNFNSLDSVLGEIIRLEYFSFNNNLLDSQVKQEQVIYGSNMTCQSSQLYNEAYDLSPMQSHAIGHENVPQSTGGIYENGCDVYTAVHINAPLSSFRPLNEPEQLKLREIKSACKALYDPIEVETGLLDMGDDRIKVKQNLYTIISTY